MEENYNDEEKKESIVRCDACKKMIEFGEKTFAVEEGFIGPRAFVPLAKELLFCGEKCLREYFANGNGEDDESEKLPRRIP